MKIYIIIMEMYKKDNFLDRRNLTYLDSFEEAEKYLNEHIKRKINNTNKLRRNYKYINNYEIEAGDIKVKFTIERLFKSIDNQYYI